MTGRIPASIFAAVLFRQRRRVALAALALPFVAWISVGCAGEDAPPADRYPSAAAVGVDPGGLARAHAALSSNSYPRSFLVERDGVVVMEEYYGGAGPDTYFDVRSVTKSIVSLLVGQALDEGRLRSLDQAIGDMLDPILPGLADEKRAISIRHLLTMTSGLPWQELGSSTQDFGVWLRSPDHLRWILEKPFETRPGERWHYNSAACHVLSPILAVASGAPTRQLAEEDLFGPLDATVGVWSTDSRGHAYGGHGIHLMARTMARIGRLVLDGGTWRGRRIVPRAWIEESTATSVRTEGGIPWGTGYGYLWWTHTDPRTGLRFFYANGYGGQFIVNVPARNTTIVATTLWDGLPGSTANSNWSLVLGTIVEEVLPSLRE